MIKGNHITSIIIWPYIHEAQCIVIQLQEKRPLREKKEKKNQKHQKSFNDQPPVCILVPLMGFKVILLAPCEVFLCQ